MMEMNNLLGKILGNRYVLLEKIGDGGMSLVYKARCQLLNRYVAIKVLRPEFITDEDFINKFKRESLAAASLSHPNIVGIYDVGEQDGIYYIVMEYVNGKTLKEYIKEKGKLDYRETLEISGKIALALENAHKNGVTHRDIKPHNILITDDGIIKVTDFGIARATTSSTMANTGRIMGSVHYFSPEQARGGFSDHRTDIYSLGIVIYEMLTGRLPYEADSPISIAIKHIQESFVEPWEMDKSIPRAVNDIVVRAMKKDMNGRYQSSRDLISDIHKALKEPDKPIYESEYFDEHTRVIPVGEIERALEEKNRIPKRRKRIWISLIAAVSIFIIGTLAVYFYNNYYLVPEVEIPRISGLDQGEARRILQERGLKMEVAGSRYNELPENSVIQTIQGEGSMLKRDSTVRVIISLGPQKISVPDLRNLDMFEAEAQLIKAGLGLDKDSIEKKNSDTVAKGLVIDQEPKADTEAILGTKVKIVISEGPEIKYTTIPDLVGKTYDEAKLEIKRYNLALGEVRTRSDENRDYNAVLWQSGKAGDKVKEGTVIDIIINDFQNNNNQTGGNGTNP